jgi:hypothetical protein
VLAGAAEGGAASIKAGSIAISPERINQFVQTLQLIVGVGHVPLKAQKAPVDGRRFFGPSG